MQNKRPDPHKEKTHKKNLISVSIIQVQSTMICQGNSSYFSESGTMLKSSADYLHSRKLHPTLSRDVSSKLHRTLIPTHAHKRKRSQ